MLSRIFAKKKKIENDVIVNAIISQTAALVNDLHQKMNLRFNELSHQVSEIEKGLVQLETKLLTKDLKDKQAYGLLHYKLHEVKNLKLQEEINTLEVQLRGRKENPQDQ